ncbi:putative uncharacterized protein DDB_G0282133 isoform X2 [Diorhabda carinulata]|uniref:putative uncharacterized protein DDB_G0282133 isoform X2 n=1 Tax=Diorhabda carinulata TaxID=1163345 RepID=UPI0025A06680|nr:putative uncharacterized protein DDB_G0282133 isoform X2 [Diorhabda carinulata]
MGCEEMVVEQNYNFNRYQWKMTTTHNYTPRCAGIPKNLVAWMCSLRCSSHYAKKSSCENQSMNMNVEGECKLGSCFENNQKSYSEVYNKPKKKIKCKNKGKRRNKMDNVICMPCQENERLLQEPYEADKRITDHDDIDDLEQILYYPEGNSSVQKCKNRRITFHTCPKYNKTKDTSSDHNYDVIGQNQEITNLEDKEQYEETEYDENEIEDDSSDGEEEKNPNLNFENDTNKTQYYTSTPSYDPKSKENNVYENMENKDYKTANIPNVCSNCGKIKSNFCTKENCENINDDNNEANESYSDSNKTDQKCYRCGIEERVRNEIRTKTQYNRPVSGYYDKRDGQKKNTTRTICCYCSNIKQPKDDNMSTQRKNYCRKCLYKDLTQENREGVGRSTGIDQRFIEYHDKEQPHVYKNTDSKIDRNRISSTSCSCQETYVKNQNDHICDYCNIEESKQSHYEPIPCPKLFENFVVNENRPSSYGKRNKNNDHKKCMCQEMCVNLEQFDTENNECLRKSSPESYKRPSRKNGNFICNVNNVRNSKSNKNKMEPKKQVCSSYQRTNKVENDHQPHYFRGNYLFFNDERDTDSRKKNVASTCECIICKQQSILLTTFDPNNKKWCSKTFTSHVSDAANDNVDKDESEICGCLYLKNINSYKSQNGNKIPIKLCFCQENRDEADYMNEGYEQNDNVNVDINHKDGLKIESELGSYDYVTSIEYSCTPEENENELPPQQNNITISKQSINQNKSKSSTKDNISDPHQKESAASKKQTCNCSNINFNVCLDSNFISKKNIDEPQQIDSTQLPSEYFNANMDDNAEDNISRKSVASRKTSIYEPQQIESTISQKRTSGYFNENMDNNAEDNILRKSVASRKTSIYEPQPIESTISQKRTSDYFKKNLDNNAEDNISRKSVASRKTSIYEPQQIESTISQKRTSDYFNENMDNNAEDNISRKSVASRKTSIYEPQQIESTISQKRTSGYFNENMDNNAEDNISRKSIASRKTSIYEPQQIESTISQKRTSGYFNANMDNNAEDNISRKSVALKKTSIYEPQPIESTISQKRTSGYFNANMDNIAEDNISRKSVALKKTSIYEPQPIESTISQKRTSGYFNANMDNNAEDNISRKSVALKKTSIYEPQPIESTISQKRTSDYFKKNLDNNAEDNISRKSVASRKTSIYEPQQIESTISQKRTSGYFNENMDNNAEDNISRKSVASRKTSIYEPQPIESTISQKRTSGYFNANMDNNAENNVSRKSVTSKKDSIYEPQPRSSTIPKQQTISAKRNSVWDENIATDYNNVSRTSNLDNNLTPFVISEFPDDNTDLMKNISKSKLNQIVDTTTNVNDTDCTCPYIEQITVKLTNDENNLPSIPKPVAQSNENNSTVNETVQEKEREASIISKKFSLYRSGSNIVPNNTNPSQNSQTQGNVSKNGNFEQLSPQSENELMLDTHEEHSVHNQSNLSNKSKAQSVPNSREDQSSRSHPLKQPKRQSKQSIFESSADKNQKLVNDNFNTNVVIKKTSNSKLSKCRIKRIPKSNKSQIDKIQQGSCYLICKCIGNQQSNKRNIKEFTSYKEDDYCTCTTNASRRKSSKNSNPMETRICECSDTSTQLKKNKVPNTSRKYSYNKPSSEKKIIAEKAQIPLLSDNPMEINESWPEDSAVFYSKQDLNEIDNKNNKSDTSIILNVPIVNAEKKNEENMKNYVRGQSYDGSQRSRRSVEFVCPPSHLKSDQDCDINELTEVGSKLKQRRPTGYAPHEMIESTYSILEPKKDDGQSISQVLTRIEEKEEKENGSNPVDVNKIEDQMSTNKCSCRDEIQTKECYDYGNLKGKKQELPIKQYICKNMCRDDYENEVINGVIDEDRPCPISEYNIYESMIKNASNVDQTQKLCDYGNLKTTKIEYEVQHYICKDMCKENENGDDEIHVGDVPCRISECNLHENLSEKISGKCLCQNKLVEIECYDYGNLKEKLHKSQVEPYVCDDISQQKEEEKHIADSGGNDPRYISEFNTYESMNKSESDRNKLQKDYSHDYGDTEYCSCRIENTEFNDEALNQPYEYKNIAENLQVKNDFTIVSKSSAHEQIEEVGNIKCLEKSDDCPCKNIEEFDSANNQNSNPNNYQSDYDANTSDNEEKDTNNETTESEMKNLSNIFQNNLKVIDRVEFKNLEKTRTTVADDVEQKNEKPVLDVCLCNDIFRKNVNIFGDNAEKQFYNNDDWVALEKAHNQND